MCRYISSLVFSLLLVLPLHAQKRIAVQEEKEDSVPLLNGFAVGVDLVGPVQSALSDYGQYEASLRINLRDTYFPIVEAGLGRASHDDMVTLIKYESKAPYFRLGMDYNLMKDKHAAYRIYGGARYALTYFSYDLSHPGLTDPYWGDKAPYQADGVKCHYHWIEFAAGVDAKILGPVHFGWSVRYRKRLFHDSGDLGNVWYVPGLGKSGSTRMGFLFILSIDI